METATLDDFMALNDQLAALVEAGVPLDVEIGRSGADAAANLERINATIARRVSQGASLSEALDRDERLVTSSYGTLVQLGLAAGDPSAALNASTRSAQTALDARQAALQSLVYPVIVCALSYIGLVAFCSFFVPTLEGMFVNARMQPGFGLKILQALRSTLPYWIAIPPIGMVLLVTAAQARTKSRGLSWLPGMSRAIGHQRSANFADSLATLLENGKPLNDALQIAAGVWDDLRQEEAVRSLAARLREGQPLSEDSAAMMRLGPLLRYALCHADASVGRVRALRMAADFYRESARHRLERLRLFAPMVLCVTVGGLATLLYGLSLFVPVVEMLRGLAK